ncbi:MAG: hypothetical protein C0483_24230 [Pirellula sp.]|nr:hypothetical protein [Pirellula sp.]
MSTIGCQHRYALGFLPMCGRFTLRAWLGDLAAQFALDAALEYESSEFQPTNDVPIVRMMDGKRTLTNAKWWIIPFWSKTGTPDSRYPSFNARAETVAEKPTYREPFNKRRSLVLTDRWFEWKVVGGTKSNPVKQKYMMHLSDQRPFALAGLWDRWEGNGEVVESCTVIVGDPTPALAGFHDRMPIVLPQELHAAWLAPELQERKPLGALLEQFDVKSVVGSAIGEPKATRSPRKGKN